MIGPHRPIEATTLLNPAFCGLLLNQSVQNFDTASSHRGMPFALLFLVLPLILHRPTRDKLPRSVRTKMHSWLQENPELRIGVAGRVREMIGITREALIFSAQHGVLSIRDDGTVASARRFRVPAAWHTDDELLDCWRKASVVGGWLGSGGEPATVFVMWGLRP
jgi:hypothetical protein